MSVPQVPLPEDPLPEHPPPLPPSNRGLGGCAMVFLVLVGVVLLLPGLCSLVAMGMFGGSGGLGLIYLLTFAVAAGGIALIRYAVRNR
jgi:hypothetical protein